MPHSCLRHFSFLPAPHQVTQVHCNATWATANIWPKEGETPKQIHQAMEKHKRVLAVQYEYF